jgi:hypothetical protein
MFIKSDIIQINELFSIPEWIYGLSAIAGVAGRAGVTGDVLFWRRQRSQVKAASH